MAGKTAHSLDRRVKGMEKRYQSGMDISNVGSAEEQAYQLRRMRQDREAAAARHARQDATVQRILGPQQIRQPGLVTNMVQHTPEGPRDLMLESDQNAVPVADARQMAGQFAAKQRPGLSPLQSSPVAAAQIATAVGLSATPEQRADYEARRATRDEIAAEGRRAMLQRMEDAKSTAGSLSDSVARRRMISDRQRRADNLAEAEKNRTAGLETVEKEFVTGPQGVERIRQKGTFDVAGLDLEGTKYGADATREVGLSDVMATRERMSAEAAAAEMKALDEQYAALQKAFQDVRKPVPGKFVSNGELVDNPNAEDTRRYNTNRMREIREQLDTLDEQRKTLRDARMSDADIRSKMGGDLSKEDLAAIRSRLANGWTLDKIKEAAANL